MPLQIFDLAKTQEFWLDELLKKTTFPDKNFLVRRALDFCAKNEGEFLRFINGKN